MNNMILTQFLIGEEFDLHEFELDYLETKVDNNGIEFNYYRYTGSLENMGAKDIILAYNCDVLRGIIISAIE